MTSGDLHYSTFFISFEFCEFNIYTTLGSNFNEVKFKWRGILERNNCRILENDQCV